MRGDVWGVEERRREGMGGKRRGGEKARGDGWGEERRGGERGERSLIIKKPHLLLYELQT